ncbi:hypothetical protein THTE_3232 [Thermogutta terrifontis]|uniref:Uncharacterized protein n=1 Tax=Thermogutta terrifontis TaxID=1331910 RepID=A0A286RIQ0_9BACT|nr:hypothetical protein THTE_3232 [Thermogutta terrifontis]
MDKHRLCMKDRIELSLSDVTGTYSGRSNKPFPTGCATKLL